MYFLTKGLILVALKITIKTALGATSAQMSLILAAIQIALKVEALLLLAEVVQHRFPISHTVDAG